MPQVSGLPRSTKGLPLFRDVSFAARLTWPIVLLLLTCGGAGLLYGRSGLYDSNALTFPAQLGQDAVMLMLAVPLLLVSFSKARRGSARGLLCWMGTLFFIAYFYSFYVIGIRFNFLFPAYIALVSMSMYGALALFFALNLEELHGRFRPQMPARLIGGFLMATSLTFAALWLTYIGRSLLARGELDTVSRVVIALDGVVLLPLSFFAGLWLWRAEALGYALSGMLLLKLSATFLTLVATTLFSIHWEQRVDTLQSCLYVAGLIGSVLLMICWLRALQPQSEGSMPALIERYMPQSDVAESHEILVRAPAESVFEVACNFDLRSITVVNAIFWLREKLMRVSPPLRLPKGIVEETLALGWGVLGYRPGRELVMGAVTQPWVGDVRFRAVAAGDFLRFDEPDLVKIAWTLEAEPLDSMTTRFRTQTRVLATDESARRKFRRYWKVFGSGIILIRWFSNRAIRREAEKLTRVQDAMRRAG